MIAHAYEGSVTIHLQGKRALTYYKEKSLQGMTFFLAGDRPDFVVRDYRLATGQFFQQPEFDVAKFAEIFTGPALIKLEEKMGTHTLSLKEYMGADIKENLWIANPYKEKTVPYYKYVVREMESAKGGIFLLAIYTYA